MALADVTSHGAVTPIDTFLAAQADLRAVDRFARADVSNRTGQWSDLIPLSAPAPGEQYRFDVDLDSCTGCKACVTACHSLNGLDEAESFRSIGLLVTNRTTAGTAAAAVTPPAEQTVTTACHHCADPGCLTGCPAEAYEKDPITGIVKHLDDACIGCQYCTLTCPYDVPVYNDRLGIVRKCDMCADRLADGEAPACVQGCPTSAISVTTVAAGAPVEAERLLPGAASSAITHPTTRFRGRLVDALASGDITSSDPTPAVPQHDHMPLVVMLVLSQWSVGVLVSALARDTVSTSASTELGLVVAAGLGATSAAASLLHLGQPLKAWRAVLGWSHSWLSREALALSAYIGAATTAAVLSVLDWDTWSTAVGLGAAVLGIGTVVCSTMIYAVTGRRLWSTTNTAKQFASTAIVAALSWFVVAGDGGRIGALVAVAGIASVIGIAFRDAGVLQRANDVDLSRSAGLLRGPLRRAARVRFNLAMAGVGCMLLAIVIGSGPIATAGGVAAIALLAAGEFMSRRLFFQACAPSTMPGAHR